jgi:energy-coupling factor transport system substrate-specific component
MTSISYALLGVVLALGFGWYERTRPPARVVALVAAMAALSVVGRLAFAALPNVKPTTDIVLFAGYALGGVPGFVVGAVTALASNVFFGQGPWTAWQMVAWGGVGVGGALLARLSRGREPGRAKLALACAVAGAGFGAFMDVYQWSFTAEQTAGSYGAVAGTSLPYNLAHVIGNVGFALVIGPTFIRMLRRYRRRFDFSWEQAAPAPAASRKGTGLAVALLLAVFATSALAAAAPQARAATPAAKATRYLERTQNRDGGLPAFKGGGGSSALFSGWAALGLASAGKNPQDVKVSGGRSLVTYVGRGSFGDTGALERTILVIKAAGLSPRRYRGRNLVARLAGRRRADGSWAGNVAHTAFGIMALKAGGVRSLSAPANYLGRAQNGDGGFGYVPSASSDVDDTGAALQALAAAGRRGSGPVGQGVAFLRSLQNADGGWGQTRGRTSNAQSTAWAVQGLVAAGVGVRSAKGDPLRFLAGLQRRDGHIAYSRSSNQTPVWVTAQALTALRKKPFPLAATRRARRRSHKAAAAAAGTATASGARSAKATPKPRAPARKDEAPAPAMPTRKERAGPVGVAPRRTAAAGSADGDPAVSRVLAGGALAAVLALLWLARRRLHLHRWVKAVR